MKNKHFYTYLVETTNITIELANLDMTNEERIHLLSLVEANMHSRIIGGILDNLVEEDKKIFLQNVAKENHEKTWEHLKIKLEKAEEKIQKIIDKTSEELLKDIKAAQNKS